MNDDELKKLWRQQPLRIPDTSPEQLVSAMQKQTTQLRRSLLARDARELAACLVVILIFGFYYFSLSQTPLSRLGDLIVIGSSIFIAWKLVHARRNNPPAPPGAAVVASLRAELNAVRAQSQLLGSVLWWYLLPLGIGILLCTAGGLDGGVGGIVVEIFYLIAVVALYAWIYRLNQTARARQLLPVEAQLESLIRSAETGAPSDETHLAGLRPIVLSMHAADRVKPVEFKVAFWQLAIYGIPGIVGIWFFLTIALTLGSHDWQVAAQNGETPAPIVDAKDPNETDQTNRYFIVTRKLVDLFNSGDYPAVHRLYNGEMTKVFPLKETSDFYSRLASNAGRIDKFDGPIGGGYRGWTAYRLQFQRSEMMMSLALDANDKISGIYFQPTPVPFTSIKIKNNIKPFLVRFSSWQHLLWGALSFLGGLIYTRLIQKTTARAVGISSLGIHLQKGMNLVLWGEIKEVRPFKFLNIRNLWLIQASGEKTLMHWTPLERHPELIAAVEKCAPPNHPIRSHVSVLRKNHRS